MLTLEERSSEVACKQVRLDALDEPFEELGIRQSAFYSEWILVEIGLRFLSVRAVDPRKQNERAWPRRSCLSFRI